jgi:hypothetical protein
MWTIPSNLVGVVYGIVCVVVWCGVVLYTSGRGRGRMRRRGGTRGRVWKGRQGGLRVKIRYI